MSGLILLESGVGFVLVFFLPGYAISRALFPEWRLRGPLALRRLVELTTLSFVLSVTLTALVGYGLLTAAPGGFQAAWSNPVLEGVLLGVTVVAGGAGVARGAYRRDPLASPAPSSSGGEEGAFELTRQLDLLGREERRIRHGLRSPAPTPPERDRLRHRLEEIEEERADLSRRREAEYAE